MGQTAVDNVVKLDSRKFLSAINDSAQAKVAYFEDRIREMGKAAGKEWRLAALRSSELYFEDVAGGQYYIAEHSKDGRKVTIGNIRAIQIMEEEKAGIFNDSCVKLIDAIEENDQQNMHAAFSRMKSQRFSGRAIPYSGYVRCQDRVLRRINVASGNSFGEDIRGKLVSAIVEGLRDNVVVENGQVISGVFNDGEEIKLPVTKWASRKLVARRMQEAAKDAFWSQGFQKRVRHIAGLVAESKIEEAVKALSPFLDEMEEFTLLTRAQTQSLIENALAANAIFNQQLCNDTATLFHRTNLKLNKSKIVEEWRSIARKAEHPILAENVQILSESANFEAAYDKFLTLIFEAISNREVAAEALATTLEVLRNKTPKIRESHDLSSKLENLIARLKQTDFDDAAIYEAEDLIATIQEELAATETLGSFDQIPGSGQGAGGAVDTAADPLAGAGGAGGGGTPPIVINSPLIQIGGTSGAAGGGAEEPPMPPPDMGMEDPAADPTADPNAAAGGAPAPGAPGAGGQDDELAALLGGGGLGENRRRGKAVSESRPNHYEMKPDSEDDSAGGEAEDEEEVVESTDPYAIKPNEFKLAENSLLSNYGAPVITDDGELRRIVNIMHRLAEEHQLTGNRLQENVEAMAKAGMKAVGLRIPNGRMNKAVEQIVSLFESERPFPGAAKPFGGKGGKDKAGSKGKPFGGKSKGKDKPSKSGKPWENDDEGVAEDQYHPPRIPARGYGKTSFNRHDKKKGGSGNNVKKESISWGDQQADAMLGEYAGVRFIFDHGGERTDLTPVILSEDGAVEIPIPEHLYNSAFAAANMIDDEQADSAPFLEWLDSSIEQIRPISEDEDRALEEAMARITTGPDGTINVEVTDDVGVGEAGEGGMGGETGMDDGMGGEEGMEGQMGDLEPEEGLGGEEMGGEEMGGGAGDGMEPVDSLDVGNGAGAAEAGGEDAMPDYEQDQGMETGAPAAPQAGPPQAGPPQAGPTKPAKPKQGGMPFEDKDITDPQSSKYTQFVKDNPRSQPEHKPTGDADDELEDIGPELKKDDGSGTNPPTAKK